jgi:hypothetical protein
MKSRTFILSILFTAIMLFKLGRCIMATQPTMQTIENERNLEKYGSYESRYKQWEQKYGKSYVESLSEEERAVFLKDVTRLTKNTNEIGHYSPTSSWDSIKNDYLVICYPKNWVVTVDTNTKVYTFDPISSKSKKADGQVFHAELVGDNSIKRLISQANIEKEKIFPMVANIWWEEKAKEGFNIRGISRIKFLGYEAYCANGQMPIGEIKLSSTIYLINTPQGIYQFTMAGNPESMIQYAKTATNIIQTLNLRKEI